MTRLALAALALAACSQPADAGLMRRDGLTLRAQLPACAAWWDEQLGMSAICAITVEEADLPPGVLGRATVGYDGEGHIYQCRIEMQRGEWQPHHLRHEIGHCLGLADDAPSLDLDSIMSSPTHGGEVTAADREAIRGDQ